MWMPTIWRSLVLAVSLASALWAPAAPAEDAASNAAAPNAAPPDAAALVQRVIDSAPKIAFEADAVLTAPGGFTRDLKLLHKQVSGTEATYMEVSAPLNLKDTRFLFLERTTGTDEQYIYVPALKRTIQVLDDARKQPFLGSDFYVSDLVAPDVAAYTYAFASVPDADVAGRKCKLVEAVPKQLEGELYGKTVIAIDPADLLVMRSEFYDPKGKLLKVWTLEKVEKIDGQWTPVMQKMANVQTSTSSTLETKRVKYGAELSDSVFTRSHLQR